MDLPSQITALFDNVKTGVLVPVLQGLYDLGPYLLVIAIVAATFAFFFSRNVGVKAAAVLIPLLMWFVWPHIPDLLAGLTSYNGAPTDATAISALKDAAAAGVNDALGALGD